MRRRVINLLVVGLFLFSFSCCASVIAQEKKAEVPVVEKVVEKKAEAEKPKVEKPKPKTMKEAMEALTPDDPRQARVELLNVKIKYLQEHLRAIELEYTGLCYKDKRHWTAKNELEQLVQELRRLLIN